jgi:hypothetical protein
MKRALSILFFLTLAVFASAKQPPAVWAGLKMDGLTMDLQDSHYVEWLYFYGSGDVMATVGPKDGPGGGYLAGTGYAWRVRGEWLEFLIERDKPFRRIRAISVSKYRIVARTDSGETVIYKLKRSKI